MSRPNVSYFNKNKKFSYIFIPYISDSNFALFIRTIKYLYLAEKPFILFLYSLYFCYIFVENLLRINSVFVNPSLFAWIRKNDTSDFLTIPKILKSRSRLTWRANISFFFCLLLEWRIKAISYFREIFTSNWYFVNNEF